MSNSDYFPWQDIADGNIFENGIYLFEIKAFNDGKASTGKRMPKARFNCLEPANCRNMTFFDQYVVGTDEQPEDVIAGTMGARSMKQVFTAAQVAKGNNVVELMANSVGSQLLIQLNKYEEKDGEYKGTLKNRAVGMYKIGEREVGITGDTKAKGPAPKSSAPKPMTSPAPVTMLKCTSCGKDIPKAEYSAHVESCNGSNPESSALPVAG